MLYSRRADAGPILTARTYPTRTRRPVVTKILLTFAYIAVIMSAAAGSIGGAPTLQIPVLTSICEIQAGGGTSPLLAALVTVEGVVTSDFIESEVGGFFMQAPECDGDPETSDGILVYLERAADITVTPGDIVRVTGTVKEHFGLTEISVCTPDPAVPPAPPEPHCAVELIGSASVPEPMLLDIPAEPSEAAGYLEAREGMWVALPPQSVVGATNAHGEAYVVPAASGIRRLFRWDNDGRSIGLHFPMGWQVLDHGDVIDGLVGALNFTFGNYKLATSADDLTVVRAGAEPPRAAPSTAGELTIATYNIENFFDSVDDPGKNDAEWTLSEADYALAVARRARSIRHHLGAPDIIGLQEVETMRALTDLAEHEHLKDLGYAALLVDGPDGRGIDVGLLYRSERLELIHSAARQKCVAEEPFGGPIGACELPDGGPGYQLFGRPPLVAGFEVRGTDGKLAVIVNHFKSKSGGDAGTTAVRTTMAYHVIDLVQELEEAEVGVPIFVLGDLNDFEDSAPLRAFADAEFVDLRTHVPAESDFTYVFNGVSQNLDYILTRPSIEALVIDFGPLHVNADFGAPPPGEPDHPSPRVSDHDPVLLRIQRPGRPRSQVWLPLVMDRFAIPAGPSSTPTPTIRPTVEAPPEECPVAPKWPLRITELFYDGEVPIAESDEFIEFENVSGERVSLDGFRIVSVRGDQVYSFASDAEINSGERCRVYTDLNDDVEPGTPCSFNWNHTSGGVWNNSGDTALIESPDGTVIDREWYGGCNCDGLCGD